MAGFNPLQGMNLGLQNLGANIRAMTQNIVTNSINQAQTSFQSSIANAIQRAEADGTRFDFQTELRAGEFRQFTDQTGTTRGFYHRYCIVSVGLNSKTRIYSTNENLRLFCYWQIYYSRTYNTALYSETKIGKTETPL